MRYELGLEPILVRTTACINVLDIVIAVNILTNTPMASVTAKPLITGMPEIYRIRQVMRVEIFESLMLVQALLKPASIPTATELPARISSFIRSNIRILASTAIPILSIKPAIPASVNTIGDWVMPESLNISIVMRVYMTSAAAAT